jgi:hypothetical protein
MTVTSDQEHATVHLPDRPARRWAPATGIAFVVLFIVSVVASTPPADGASDAAWLANYTGAGHKAGHVVTGVALTLAGLCLLSFMVTLWTRLSRQSTVRLSPLPMAAAAVSAACLAMGGMLMGGAISVMSAPTPNADILRLCNDVGFIMVGIAGMLAAALSVVTITLQARSTGQFGSRMTAFGVVVSVVLLAGAAFVPIVALLAWLVVVAISLLRNPQHS